jgi:hypothetical protein
MKTKMKLIIFSLGLLQFFLLQFCRNVQGLKSELNTLSDSLAADKGSLIIFYGDSSAYLYSRELKESMEGILKYNFVTDDTVFPAGFVHASPVPQGWSGTCWTRDGGTFLRELVKWNYLNHACIMARCLMKMVARNESGYYSFPQYFDRNYPESGDELDGTSSIILGLTELFKTLPDGNNLKQEIYQFLHQSSSPVTYIRNQLKGAPLLKGDGEFGGGCNIQGFYFNVVQNNLSALALEAVADIEQTAGDKPRSDSLKLDAERIIANMQKYLVSSDGCWIWCIDPVTLKPDSAIINAPINLGFGGLNGVLSMYSDVHGFVPQKNNPVYIHSIKTFQKLYNTPLRKEQFEKYGIWTQFDVFRAGLATSPSYGQGYAMQVMLLIDSLRMVSRATDYFSKQTFNPIAGYLVHRKSPYYIYERMYSPEAYDKTVIEEGCGALNLVNVTEHLKVGRIMLGIDDSNPDTLKIIPRIPGKWTGYKAVGWPVRTTNGLTFIDIIYKKEEGDACLKVRSSNHIKAIKLRLPSENGWCWIEKVNCKKMTARN